MPMPESASPRAANAVFVDADMAYRSERPRQLPSFTLHEVHGFDLHQIASPPISLPMLQSLS